MSHPLAEEVIDLSGVFDHTLSTAHLLLSALHPALQHPLHIPKNHILMEDTQQGLQTGRKSVIQADRQAVNRQVNSQSHLSAGRFQVSQVGQLLVQRVQQRIHDRK